MSRINEARFLDRCLGNTFREVKDLNGAAAPRGARRVE